MGVRDRGVSGNPSRRRRLAALAAVPVTAALLAAPAAPRPPSLHFTTFPTRAVVGGSVSVAASLPRPKDACTAELAYANGAVQSGAAKPPTSGARRVWTWTVPATAATGTGRVSVSCRASGGVDHALVVVAAPVPKVDVVKQGFSIRTSQTSTTASFGVVLANRSKTEDATEVSVLVNLVNASNALIGSQTSVIQTVHANTQSVIGGSVNLPGGSALNHLEVVVHVGGSQPSVPSPVPVVANARIVPDAHDPAWVASIDGELRNESSKLVLNSASISAVVLDSGGNVVGGGSGYASGTLPPGSREFVQLSSGVTSVPVANAASVEVTVTPTYAEQSG
jgi:hypothetical protein